MQITRGGIKLLNANEQSPINVQITSMKTIPPNRVQVSISDGTDAAPAMLTTQLVKDSIKVNCLFQIRKYICSDLGGKKLFVILEGESLGECAPVAAAAPAQQQMPPAPQQYGAPAANPVPSYGSAAPSYQQARPPAAPQAAYGAGQQSGGYGATKPMPSSYGAAPNSRPVMKDDGAGATIMPINAINPYSSRWTIKARITSKSELRRWSNAKGEGTLFSIDLLDSDGGEIRATFFKEACEKFFPVLEEGKVYTFSGGTLKMVQNRQFSNIKNQYELTFGVHSTIMAASDDAGIQKQHYEFVKIAAIANQEVGATVDVIAVVKHATDVSEIVSTKQSGKVMHKRELTLVDDSNAEVRVTIWGDKANSTQYDWHSAPITAFKGLKVGDYGGRSLSAGGSTSIQIRPEIPEGFALNGWQQGLGGALPTGASLTTSGSGRDSSGVNEPIENRLSLVSIKDNGMGTSEKGDYGTVKAYVNFIKHGDVDPWYTACTSAGCSKKVIDKGNNTWTCEKCQIDMEECNYRYILNMSIVDDSGSTWVTAFNDQAEKLLGVSAKELWEMKATENQAGYDKVFADCLFKPVIAKLRIKQELVNDEMRTKSTVLALADIDYVAENQKLLDAIAKYQ